MVTSVERDRVSWQSTAALPLDRQLLQATTDDRHPPAQHQRKKQVHKLPLTHAAIYLTALAGLQLILRKHKQTDAQAIIIGKRGNDFYLQVLLVFQSRNAGLE